MMNLNKLHEQMLLDHLNTVLPVASKALVVGTKQQVAVVAIFRHPDEPQVAIRCACGSERWVPAAYLEPVSYEGPALAIGDQVVVHISSTTTHIDGGPASYYRPRPGEGTVTGFAGVSCDVLLEEGRTVTVPAWRLQYLGKPS